MLDLLVYCILINMFMLTLEQYLVSRISSCVHAYLNIILYLVSKIILSKCMHANLNTILYLVSRIILSKCVNAFT